VQQQQEYFINKINFPKLVERLLRDARIIAPVEFGQRKILQEITFETIERVNLFGFRTVEPFKSYWFKLTEIVSRYFDKDEAGHGKKFVFLGMRGCDLEALEVLDKVFAEGEFKDPFYISNRNENLIIGADCTDCGDTCFCTLVKGKPYPTKIFDLNLSPLAEGFVVEIGTIKGKRVIESNPNLFQKAPKDLLDARANNREKVAHLLAEKNQQFNLKLDLSELHKINLENKVWRRLTKDCVECSACNFICPTCSCFLLLDAETRNLKPEYRRYKIWDACLKAGYARVAGGANARGRLYERLQNRYHCKFDYSFDRLGRYTCVGCGRCIDGCAGEIDMRKIFVELERQVPLRAKLA
jgi:formate hydrogenlyase subunit 6/NADH:ubiquinone oxidoreductase subunit I